MFHVMKTGKPMERSTEGSAREDDKTKKKNMFNHKVLNGLESEAAVIKAKEEENIALW